ncbi:DDRGK domain-containing protein [Phthorimaea operculella]|nr:DDRGK domain-containing protein [Phthorimaea operculella]
MDPFIIAAVISAIVIVILSIAFIRVSSQVKPSAAKPRAVQQRDGGPGRVQAVRNQRARMRANAARHQNALLEEEPGAAEEADEESPPDARERVDFDDKMGAKEEERQREEAERKAEEERKRKEQEEYEALKAAFTVEGEGFEEGEQQDTDSLLRDFIEYIKVSSNRYGTSDSQTCCPKRKEQEEYEALKAAFTVEGEGFEEGEQQDTDSLLRDFIEYIKGVTSQNYQVPALCYPHFKRKEQEEYEALKAAFTVEGEGFEEGEQQDAASLLRDFIEYIKPHLKRKEQEEYEALKAAFTVEGEGFEEGEQQDTDSLLRDFIEYIKEERKRKEQEEYEALKAAFTVEGEGFEEGEQQDTDSLLRDFIEYIKAQKVVLLEDLAAHFKLKTQAAIDRIQDLQTSGELTGVIDDRGKFIYISQGELESVAKFIKQRGRVSITELAECSNDLINLNPVAVP